MSKFEVLEGKHVQNGRIFQKGDIVESKSDLCATWKNKFCEVNTSARSSVGKAVPNTASPPAQSAVDADETDKEKKAKGKKVEEESEVIEGTDVTDQFTSAVEQDFKVYKNQGAYFIYNNDDLSKPFNENGVKKADVEKTIKEAIDSN